MRIKNISIIGLGLIGGSIAKVLTKSNFNFHISAYDRQNVLDAALNEGTIHSPLKNAADSLSSDLIFLCLPVYDSIDVFKTLSPKLKKNCILTDVCGVKSIFQKEWDSIKSDGIYIGGHPMTGKEKSGYENSDSLLFENSIYIVTEDLSSKSEFADFKQVLELLGANILFIPAHQHDVIAASVSHLPQLVSVALVNTASLKTEKYNFLDLAAGGFRDMTRIASSDFKIWKSVIAENKNQILTAIDKFALELNTIKKLIQKDDLNILGKAFEEARKNRDEIPQNTKGFLNPLHDIFIFVEDKLGVISKISTALFEDNINIKDIELLKIREGTGGTFRLSFESDETAAEAKRIILDLGYRLSQ